MKILITGHKGFIGSNLCKELVAENKHNLVYFNRHQDICKLITIEQPQIIVHLAANPLVKSSLDELISDNFELTKKILSAMPEGGHLIFASSATVYGDVTSKYRVDESAPTIPTSVYGELKLACEAMINAHVLANKINATILRFVANVGPNATHGVVKDLARKYLENDTVEVLGCFPGSVKPYTYVSDTVAAIKHVINTGWCGTYNVGIEDEISVADILTEIEKVFKKGEKDYLWLGANANWKGDNPLVRVNTEKFRRTGWEPKYKTSREAINAALRG